MAGPEVTDAIFERLPEGASPRWRLRVHVFGRGFAEDAVPLEAEVGGKRLEGIHSADPEQGFTGYLREEPQQNARLTVGFSGAPLADTDVRFHGQPIPPIEIDTFPNA